MNAESAETENEIENVVTQFGVRENLTQRFVKRSHVAHNADQMNAFKYHLEKKYTEKMKICQHSMPVCNIQNYSIQKTVASDKIF